MVCPKVSAYSYSVWLTNRVGFISTKYTVAIKLISSGFGLDLSPETSVMPRTRDCMYLSPLSLYCPLFPKVTNDLHRPHTRSSLIGCPNFFSNYMFFLEALFFFCFYYITVFWMHFYFSYYVYSLPLRCYLYLETLAFLLGNIIITIQGLNQPFLDISSNILQIFSQTWCCFWCSIIIYTFSFLSRLQHWDWTHDLKIKTWAKIKSQLLNQWSHPGSLSSTHF